MRMAAVRQPNDIRPIFSGAQLHPVYTNSLVHLRSLNILIAPDGEIPLLGFRDRLEIVFLRDSDFHALAPIVSRYARIESGICHLWKSNNCCELSSRPVGTKPTLFARKV